MALPRRLCMLTVPVLPALQYPLARPLVRRRCSTAVGLSSRPAGPEPSGPAWDPAHPALYFYNDVYEFPLPEGHRFPMEKYRLVRRKLQHTLVPGGLAAFDVSPLASREDLVTTHCPAYVDRFLTGELTPGENRCIGFPWSEAGVDRAVSSTGGTVAAARAVLEDGGPRFAGQVAGGTHHAFYDYGEGFCVFSDIAVAANCALREHAAWLRRVLVVDLDVHQGNGNAVLFADDPAVFTYSAQCEQNLFSKREASDVDVWVPSGAGDDAYLGMLRETLPAVFERVRPQLVFFQAGVDGLDADRLGRLGLSREGLRQRNDLVYDLVLGGKDTRLVVTLGGGYPKDLSTSSRPFHDIVDAHADVYVQASQRLARSSMAAARREDSSTRMP
uniref:Histone deacetylase domain-containing protein n=1 Tax=Phaeomonas parva TaxID=124430 RepID=A0A7S1U809_9STRA|mmetsp:Transcript_33279/g.105238  ORF Transcript_33279/g.105238 Transcript_33279/m.105238 type:complete len:387 (+) Transcript_33279:294-1454(+)